MSELVFFLEEESARALLEQIFPRLTPPGSPVRPRFIVMRDQDQADCRKTKKSLKALCALAGRPEATVRIACRELEAFYLGDLLAVETGMEIKGLARKQNKAKFREPDRVVYPSRELQKLTGDRYQKVAGSRAIALNLNLEAPRSRSFHHLIQAILSANADLHGSTG